MIIQYHLGKTGFTGGCRAGPGGLGTVECRCHQPCAGEQAQRQQGRATPGFYRPMPVKIVRENCRELMGGFSSMFHARTFFNITG